MRLALVAALLVGSSSLRQQLKLRALALRKCSVALDRHGQGHGALGHWPAPPPQGTAAPGPRTFCAAREQRTCLNPPGHSRPNGTGSFSAVIQVAVLASSSVSDPGAAPERKAAWASNPQVRKRLARVRLRIAAAALVAMLRPLRCAATEHLPHERTPSLQDPQPRTKPSRREGPLSRCGGGTALLGMRAQQTGQVRQCQPNGAASCACGRVPPTTTTLQTHKRPATATAGAARSRRTS